jgi:hypothetical protein
MDTCAAPSQMAGIRWSPRLTASFTDSQVDALQIFDEVLERCRSLPEASIFNRELCKVCNDKIKEGTHAAKQNHRRRLICRRLLQLREEITAETTIAQLNDILKRIAAQLIAKDSEKSPFLLYMKPQFWKKDLISGSNESRREPRPDGAKLWLKMYLTDLGVLIRSVQEALDCATLLQIAPDCASLSAPASASNDIRAMQSTIADLQSIIADLMPKVRIRLVPARLPAVMDPGGLATPRHSRIAPFPVHRLLGFPRIRLPPTRTPETGFHSGPERLPLSIGGV